MINIVQILLSIALITVIILQSKGTGLGSSFGGGNSFHTKRGAEKSLFALTIILSVLFVTTALINSLL